MTYPFDPDRGLIVIQAELYGPSGSIVLRLAVDTGATGTMINAAPLAIAGYDASLAPDRIQVTTGSGVEYTPRLPVSRITALGHEQTDFPILVHTLPPSASIDGLLGLDYMRNRVLNVDFRCATVSLT